MKKFLLTVCLTVISLVTFAQSPRSVSLYGWKSVNVSYSESTLDYPKGLSDLDWNIYSIEYLKADNCVTGMPIFLEKGIGVELYRYYDKAVSNNEGTYNGTVTTTYEEGLNMVSLYVPVNLVCKIAFADNIEVMPYVGVKGQLNLWGEVYGKVQTVYGNGKTPEIAEDSYSVFDKEEGGMSIERLGLSWQIGAKVNVFDKFSVGVNYAKSFSDKIVFIGDSEDGIGELYSTTFTIGLLF